MIRSIGIFEAGACLALLMVGCSPADDLNSANDAGATSQDVDPGIDDDVGLDPGPWVQAELVMGSDVATGTLFPLESETPGSADCSAGIDLHESGWSGIDVAPVFLNREIGTSSVVDPADPAPFVPVHWSATDPDADGSAMTDQWSGTMVIAEWSDERIVIDLVDGTRCDAPGAGPGAEPTNCVPESGTLTYIGPRLKPHSATSVEPSGFVDVGTGQAICRQWAGADTGADG